MSKDRSDFVLEAAYEKAEQEYYAAQSSIESPANPITMILPMESLQATD